MRDPRHDEFERLRKRVVELGNSGTVVAYREVLELLKSEFPTVRKAAASALDKLLERDFSLDSEGKRLISLSFHDYDKLEELLQQKLSRYIRI